jgi:hypothetical protein
MPIQPSDYRDLRKLAYEKDGCKAEMKALPHLPTNAQLLAVFQAIDDFWAANASTLKASMQTAYGQTIPNVLAKKLGRAWLRWKFEQGG